MKSTTSLFACFTLALLSGWFMSQPAFAIITSSPYFQNWTPEPDAWTRGNTADSSYFGWDAMEISGKPFHGMLRVLDDSTPDLGVGTTATGTRLYQGTDGIANTAPTANGHLSGSANYYTFMDVSNDTIMGTAPASGTGGYTTVVMQVIEGIPSDGLQGMSFTMDTSEVPWTLHKTLHNLSENQSGMFWLEWSAPGNDLPFKINMTSTTQHRAIDAIQIDTFWTSGSAPVLNARQAVPEPASALLAGLGLIGIFVSRRRSR